MSDCISRLRHAIVNHLEIELLKENGLPTPDIQSAKSLKIGDFTYPLTAETLYRHSVDPEAFYTLGAVYFAFVNRTLEHSEYFQKCRQIGVPSVTLIYKRDLFAYLSGESDHSPNIAAGSKVNETNNSSKESGSLMPFRVNERVLINRASVCSLANSAKSFESVRKMAVDILLRGQRSVVPAPTSTVGSSKSNGKKAATLSAKETPTSIIIVPATLTAPVTLFNVKQFLEHGVFISMAELQKRGALGPKQSSISVERKNAKTGEITIYQVIDSIDRLKDEEWKQVVAVFVSGQHWQFKGWKWEQPVDLFENSTFSHDAHLENNMYLTLVKGYYVKYTDSQVESAVRGWNVSVLEVHRYKRHLDTQCAHKFWNTLDQWISCKTSSSQQ